MNQTQPSPWKTIGPGPLAAVIGFYLMLAALSLLPAASGPDGSMWLVLAVGFGLLLSGLWHLTLPLSWTSPEPRATFHPTGRSGCMSRNMSSRSQ